MRLCANENIPEDCVLALRQAGHDVSWIREVAPGSADASVLNRAFLENRILLTFDKDFGQLVFQRGMRNARGLILLRIPQTSSGAVARRVVAILGSREDWEGSFSVVDDNSIRMRPLL